MLNWIKTNRTGLLLTLGIVGLLVLQLTMAGCRLSDLISVRVPSAVQSTTGSATSVTLTEATDLYDVYLMKCRQGAQAFADKIDDATMLHSILTSFGNTALLSAEGPLSSIPLGGTILGAGGLLAGLFFKAPGTSKMVAKEKEASYNTGIKLGQTLTP